MDIFPSSNLRNIQLNQRHKLKYSHFLYETRLQALVCIPLMDAGNVLNAASRILHFTQVTIYI